MPTSNVKYPFEVKVLVGLEKLASKLGVSSEVTAFIIQLNDEGKMLKTLDTVNHPYFNFRGDWHEDDEFKSFLFLNIMGHDEYILVKWQGITKDKLEELLNITFRYKDFVSDIDDDATSFPITHKVIF